MMILLKTDGTGHTIIQPIDVYLGALSGDPDVTNSFSIVTSLRNQSKLRQHRVGWC